MAGPLQGVRVVEIGALGPAPFCAMLLADMGADVLRVERPHKTGVLTADAQTAEFDLLSRGRPSAAIDLRNEHGVALVHRLTQRADVFIEGMRPGVAERLGVGPEDLCAGNDRLVYGRMTGWGRTGPIADRAGHDINYISVSGVLAAIGRRGQPPTPPLNLVADFGGGGLLLAWGIACALVERQSSGRGQVVDAAMIDGSALLMTPIFGAHASGFWSDERGTNMLDSGAPWYDVYETADGKWMSVGAVEPQFYAELLATLGLGDDPTLPDQHDVSRWPELRRRLSEVFRRRTRREWEEVFEDVDACVAPVLTMAEAPDHPQNRAWGTFCRIGGVVQPAPAPRFDRSVPDPPSVPQPAGANTDEALRSWGVGDADRERLRTSGAIL
ncbi:MAG: Acetyl-CoA:oxalate CoA-transferase [Acidimicrobiales bacterium]|nr:MAG: CoA transferase [Actinomycetota bacterium]MBV6507844.1 Acetyl-CoA:oxalate CoA-transferase [Acidimicrobiales bacterium]RIK05994.1 MAG: carnitine dehydratase [Acidobacteriota bacterium]